MGGFLKKLAYWAFSIAYWAFSAMDWAFPIAIGRSHLMGGPKETIRRRLFEVDYPRRLYKETIRGDYPRRLYEESIRGDYPKETIRGDYSKETIRRSGAHDIFWSGTRTWYLNYGT